MTINSSAKENCSKCIIKILAYSHFCKSSCFQNIKDINWKTTKDLRQEKAKLILANIIRTWNRCQLASNIERSLRKVPNVPSCSWKILLFRSVIGVSLKFIWLFSVSLTIQTWIILSAVFKQRLELHTKEVFELPL